MWQHHWPTAGTCTIRSVARFCGPHVEQQVLSKTESTGSWQLGHHAPTEACWYERSFQRMVAGGIALSLFKVDLLTSNMWCSENGGIVPVVHAEL